MNPSPLSDENDQDHSFIYQTLVSLTLSQIPVPFLLEYHSGGPFLIESL